MSELLVNVGDRVICTEDCWMHRLYQKVGIVENVFSDDSFYVNFGDGPVRFFSDECEGILEIVGESK